MMKSSNIQKLVSVVMVASYRSIDSAIISSTLENGGQQDNGTERGHRQVMAGVFWGVGSNEQGVSDDSNVVVGVQWPIMSSTLENGSDEKMAPVGVSVERVWEDV